MISRQKVVKTKKQAAKKRLRCVVCSGSHKVDRVFTTAKDYEGYNLCDACYVTAAEWVALLTMEEGTASHFNVAEYPYLAAIQQQYPYFTEILQSDWTPQQNKQADKLLGQMKPQCVACGQTLECTIQEVTPYIPKFCPTCVNAVNRLTE